MIVYFALLRCKDKCTFGKKKTKTNKKRKTKRKRSDDAIDSLRKIKLNSSSEDAPQDQIQSQEYDLSLEQRNFSDEKDIISIANQEIDIKEDTKYMSELKFISPLKGVNQKDSPVKTEDVK